MGVVGQCPALATLPIVQEAGWTLRLLWMGAKNLIPTIVQTLNHPGNGKLL